MFEQLITNNTICHLFCYPSKKNKPNKLEQQILSLNKVVSLSKTISLNEQSE